MRVYVGNLSYDATKEDLRTAFEGFGTISEVNIPPNKDDPGRNKGFGFVDFDLRGDGQKAIDAMDGVEMYGRKLRVNEARPRGERE